MAKKRKSKNYLNNRDLYDQMVLSKDQDKLTPSAEKMLMLLAERAINRMRYVSEDDRSDCLQFALLDLLKYWRNFNPKKYKGTLSINSGSGSSEHQTGIYSI